MVTTRPISTEALESPPKDDGLFGHTMTITFGDTEQAERAGVTGR